ncbi:hypothetical protein RV01_GL001775 [Enterococcus dispar]|nr:hypothetical protein RV01_GL001775 [Enterococcus dispar]
MYSTFFNKGWQRKTLTKNKQKGAVLSGLFGSKKPSFFF